MTVVAAVATRTRVVMGSDSASDADGTLVYRADGKVATFTARNDSARILIGSAGNAAILPILRRNLVIDSTPSDQPIDAWADAIAAAITDILATSTPALVDGNNIDGTLLLAWHQHLWLIHTHAAVRPHDGIAAIGCGRDLALGSLHTARLSGSVDPESDVRTAVQVACTYDSGCHVDERGPIIHSTR